MAGRSTRAWSTPVATSGGSSGHAAVVSMTSGGGRMLASYRMSWLYRWQILIAFPLFAILAVVMIVAAVRHQQGPPLAFTLLWFVTPVGTCTGSCFACAIGSTCMKMCCIGGRRCAMDGPDVVTLTQRGFKPFAAAVQAAAPHASVTVGRYARLVERLPGFSRFRSGDGK